MRYASAGRLDDLRPLTADEIVELDEHARRSTGLLPDAFVPFRLNVVRFAPKDLVLDGPEHAADGTQTLCGLTASQFFLMRHHFNSAALRACTVCASQCPDVD
jgi:hypothetical protein